VKNVRVLIPTEQPVFPIIPNLLHFAHIQLINGSKRQILRYSTSGRQAIAKAFRLRRPTVLYDSLRKLDLIGHGGLQLEVWEEVGPRSTA
jgi:hypothetical protein